MRLLAYGGTSYGERARVGNWAVATGVLGAREGLIEGESFGLGVSGAEPHLIFRALQNIESRGGYPFTLLFDPGRVTWQSLGWNAPALLSALRNKSGLFVRPEDSDVDVSVLSPQGPVYSGEPTQIHVLLAGSILSDEPLVVKPADIGFARRPTIKDLARLFAFDPRTSGNPCCCFTGMGWLIGGGRAVAEGLGARLAIDDESRTSHAVVADCRDRGQHLLDAWKRVDQWNPRVLSQLAAQPAWEWERPPSRVVARIECLASLLEPLVADQVFTDLLASWDEHAPLEGAIRDAARAAARSGPTPLSRERTAYLLEDGARFSTPIDEVLALGMNKECLIESLLSRYGSPTRIPETIRVPTNVVIDAWHRCLADTPTSLRIRRLSEAAEDLQTRSGVNDSVFALLVDEAVSSSPDSRELGEIAPLRYHPKIGAALKKRLSPQIRRTVRGVDYRQHTEVQFLWLDDDEVEQEVRDSDNPIERATEIVSSWLRDLQSRYPADVERRLEKLAKSSLRSLIKSHVKQQVAERTEVAGRPGPWSAYLCVYNLFHGAEWGATGSVDEEEKSFLRRELHQILCSETPTATPHLAGLVRLLAPLQSDTIDQIRDGKQPDPLAPGFARWQEGLKLLGLDATLNSNILRQQLLKPATSPSGDKQEGAKREVERLDSKFLLQKLRYWLLSPSVEQPELNDLDLYLRRKDLSGEGAELIEQAVRNAKEYELRNFSVRFRNPSRLQHLLEILPPHAHDMILDSVADNPEEFRVQYQGCIVTAIRKVRASMPCSLLDKAVANYLLRHQEEMNLWATTLMRGDCDGLRRWLTGILDKKEIESDQH